MKTFCTLCPDLALVSAKSSGFLCVKTPSDAAALPLPKGVAVDVPTRRRPLSMKSQSDPKDPSRGLVDGGGSVSARADGGVECLPASSGSGSRSPSDWEKGSESDNAVGVGAWL